MSKARGRRPAQRRASQSSFWRGPWPIVGTLGGIVVLVIAFVILSRLQSSPRTNPGPSADPAVIAEITHVSRAVIDAVGSGGTASPLTRGSTAVLIGPNGKPEVLYIGAEWCPYCAAERWSLVVALSHFGTFSGLHFTTSSSSDVFPDTRTLSFAGGSFSSKEVLFVTVEIEDRNHNALQTPTVQDQQTWRTYDPSGGIPFIDIANQYTAVGRGVPPDPLQGKSWQAIAGALSDARSSITIAIVGNANYLTAAICTLPQASGAAICSDPIIKQIAGGLSG